MFVKTYFVASVVLVLTACSSPSPLAAVVVRPQIITPNGDGHDDVAEVQYTVSTTSNVTVTLKGGDGKVYSLRQNQLRAPGDYEFLFGGVVGGVVLPNGDYTLTVEANAGDGSGGQRTDTHLTIQNSDAKLPEIQNFKVFPDTFTPNRDGIDDRVSMSYNLTKQADVFVYLLGPDGSKYPVPERRDNAIKAGEPGVHTYDYEGGVDLGASPPPDGAYQVIAEATDRVGNSVRASAPLTIREGGVPRAQIVGATAAIGPTSVPLGASVAFTVTVENIGTVPIRTKGPWSGTAYDSTQNFNTLGQYEEPGIFRIGMDFEGNSTGRAYPYRWGLGTESSLTPRTSNGATYYYLMPGARASVTGQIRLTDKTQFNPVSPFFWIGLDHEQVRIVNDRIAPTRITVGF